MRTKISDFTLFMTALGTLAAFRWIRAGNLPETALSARAATEESETADCCLCGNSRSDNFCERGGEIMLN